MDWKVVYVLRLTEYILKSDEIYLDIDFCTIDVQVHNVLIGIEW